MDSAIFRVLGPFRDTRSDEGESISLIVPEGPEPVSDARVFPEEGVQAVPALFEMQVPAPGFHGACRRAAVGLNAEDVRVLLEALNGFLSPRWDRPPSDDVMAGMRFGGRDGMAVLRTARTNWGEPFDEGVRFTLVRGGVDADRPEWDFERRDVLQVSLPSYELRALRDALRRVAPKAAPEIPEPSREARFP